MYVLRQLVSGHFDPTVGIYFRRTRKCVVQVKIGRRRTPRASGSSSRRSRSRQDAGEKPSTTASVESPKRPGSRERAVEKPSTAAPVESSQSRERAVKKPSTTASGSSSRRHSRQCTCGASSNPASGSSSRRSHSPQGTGDKSPTIPSVSSSRSRPSLSRKSSITASGPPSTVRPSVSRKASVTYGPSAKGRPALSRKASIAVKTSDNRPRAASKNSPTPNSPGFPYLPPKMKSPIPDYLKYVLENARSNEGGELPTYIETLAQADSSKMAVALAMVDGNVYSVGDNTVEFSIQSISKSFVYALAIEDAGLDRVLEKIGVEPSGDRFNELSLERGTNRPMNPMINAGAITAHSLVVSPNATAAERTDRILKVLSKLAGRQLSVDEEVYEAEFKNANRNMGIGYMLKAAGIITCDPAEAVKGYIRQCAINVNVQDLAMMAAVLCNAGRHPVSGEQIIPTGSVRQVLSVMTTCGMYDAAGDWVSRVGIPAKSGVAGGIIGALPGQVGIAAFSPRLDPRGNSVRGVAICEQLSREMGLHMMEVSQIARATVQTSVATLVAGKAEPHHPNCQKEVIVFKLRGAVRFAGAERLTRAVARELGEPDPKDPGSGLHSGVCAVVISLTEVYSFNPIARRITHEDIKRLLSQGKIVVVVDPGRVLDWKPEKAENNRNPHVADDETEARDFIGGTGCKAVSQEHW